MNEPATACETKQIKLSDIKPNEKNPRKRDPSRFEKLQKSIKDFPKMMELRPIVVDEAGTILGGNMRYWAIKELGLKQLPETWVRVASNLTAEETDRFIIQDNVSFGEWDWATLHADFDPELLELWGLDLPVVDFDPAADLNKEINTDLFEDEMVLKLKYGSDDFAIVKRGLAAIDDVPERALMKLLNA